MKAVTCHLHNSQDVEALVGALHAARFPSYEIAPEPERNGLVVSVFTATPLDELRAIRIMREYDIEDIETEPEAFSHRWHLLPELPRL